MEITRHHALSYHKVMRRYIDRSISEMLRDFQLLLLPRIVLTILGSGNRKLRENEGKRLMGTPKEASVALGLK
jgi:hypothetical protein